MVYTLFWDDVFITSMITLVDALIAIHYSDDNKRDLKMAEITFENSDYIIECYFNYYNLLTAC